jgi:hypothetical protein
VRERERERKRKRKRERKGLRRCFVGVNKEEL